MVKKIGILVFTSMFFSSVAIAAPEVMADTSDEQSCKSWAEEDGISKDLMAEYIKRCIAEMKEGNDENDSIQPPDSQ
ncbi:MAG: hypothetical protein HQL70_12000 [Magnetococcales bacterium]|nr:hypothetical protein [Magnetococcales bacterium]